jgi:DNA-binding MarR family transcriptional regulator
MLVAFTIEFDNEFEQRMPHRTTNFGSRSGPWLVSLVMWSNCMRFVGDEGITVRELEDLARTKTNLTGMQRWGYITMEGPARSDAVIRATPKGRQARGVWQPLSGEIEKRWQARWGEDRVRQLRESLGALIRQMDGDLPDCLPILGHGLFSRALDRKGSERSSPQDELPLPSLLSRGLFAFAVEFEREFDLSLAISANVVRVLNETGVRVRELPLLTGVSKEAISMALGFLQKKGMAVVEPDPAASRAKIARLTPKGRAAQDAYHRLVEIIEERWKTRFGERSIRTLWELLERFVAEPGAVKPYPDGWRARVPTPNTWPHYPMVLHRGGFPDGS